MPDNNDIQISVHGQILPVFDELNRIRDLIMSSLAVPSSYLPGGDLTIPMTSDYMQACLAFDNGARCVWCLHVDNDTDFFASASSVIKKTLIYNKVEAESFFCSKLPELPFGPEDI